MKLKFEGENEQETDSNDHIKIPQTDYFYNEQIKMEEIYNLKVSIKFIKILSIISITFCIIFTIFQVFQDYQFTTFQKQLNRLKTEIEELKSNNMNNNNDIDPVNNLNQKDKYNNKNKDCTDDNSLKINDFSAETVVLKEKFNKEILFLQECMTETKIQSTDKVYVPKITILIPFYRKESSINRLIQSIQKQKMKEIEIIFVEDFKYIKEFPKLDEISKIDKRIIILQNDLERGLLNSYIKGILNIKSKYMIFLEEDGMLLPYLQDLYNIVEKNNKDINDFSSLKGTINGITYDEKINNAEKTQPEISESYYNYNFINDNPLLNKIIKTEALKNAIKNINELYLEQIFDLHADTLLYICLCTYVNTYKSYGDYYGEYHLKKEFSKDQDNIEKMFNSTLYLVQYIYELKYEYEEIFNQKCTLAINLFNWPLNYNIKLNIDYKKSVEIINMFINSKDINADNKRKFNLIIRKIKDRLIYK